MQKDVYIFAGYAAKIDVGCQYKIRTEDFVKYI